MSMREVGEASAEVASRHDHLREDYFDSPVKRFVNPPPYEGLKVEAGAPSAVDAILQPGVMSVLRGILDDLATPPVNATQAAEETTDD